MLSSRTETLLSEAQRIAKSLENAGSSCRLMGACAIMLSCKGFRGLLGKLGRELSDVDLMGLSKERELSVRLMKDLGYETQWMGTGIHTYGQRMMFVSANPNPNPNTEGVHVDMFLDRLTMCHTMDFRERLRLSSLAITPADILLEKMQIVRINEKDLKDSAVLILAYKPGPDPAKDIQAPYIAKLLSNDWGFYYTFTMNLEKLCSYVQMCDAMDATSKKQVLARVDDLLETVKAEPKSFEWKLRARVGTKVKWYEEVEEVMR